MPLWQVFHPPAAFAGDGDKQAFSRAATKLYTDWGLPAFYVVVQFFPMADANVGFVGGEPAPGFVRLVVDHIAFQSMGSLAAHRHIVTGIDAVIKPYIGDKGLDCEYHVTESPPTMWKINGFVPPVMGGNRAVLAKWVADNRPSAYDEADGHEAQGNT